MKIESLGQQWCRPLNYWSSIDKAYSGAVAIVTANEGTLLLCNVERHTCEAGCVTMHVTPVKNTELLTQTEVLTWT